MERIKLTDAEYNMLLPDNIKNSDVISANAKKLLATILNYYRLNPIVKETGYLVCSNAVMRQSVGIKYNDMLKARDELVCYELISLKVGKKWKAGQDKVATQYYVRWDNIKKELKRKDFDELFSTYLDATKTEVGTTTITTTNSITTTTTNSTTFTDTNTKTIFEDKEYKNILKNNINNNILKIESKMNLKDNIKEDKTIDKPKNYKELGDYLRKRVNEFLEYVLENYQNQNILIVTHAGNGIQIRCYFEGDPPDGDYGSYKIEELSPSLTVIEVKGI